MGARVTVRAEHAGGADADGVIIRARGATCTVRFLLKGLATERDFSTPALLPAAPEVGATVKVVGGDRTGCQGTLVGLAGSDGVVQIGKMSYETLPMSMLVVLAV